MLKPPNSFGRNYRAISGLRPPVFAAGSAVTLAGPVAPTATITAGAADGEVVFDITALTADWGDAVNPGDGMGTEGVTEWWNSRDGWQVLADPEATGEVSVFLHALLWGRSEAIRLRRRNAEAVAGAAIADTLDIAGAQYEYAALMLGAINLKLGGVQLVKLTTV